MDGVWTADAARQLVAMDTAHHCLRILVEVSEQDAASALATIDAIDAVLDGAGLSVPRLYHGRDAGAWPVVEAMTARHRDVRVGLEDVLTMPDGRPARDNAALVVAAAARND